MTDFAAAVAEYRAAEARFDAPRGLYADADPRWPEDAVFGGVYVHTCGWWVGPWPVGNAPGQPACQGSLFYRCGICGEGRIGVYCKPGVKMAEEVG